MEEDGFKFESETVEELEKTILFYRTMNYKKIGNPRQDIAQYNCEKYPWLGDWVEDEQKAQKEIPEVLKDKLNELLGGEQRLDKIPKLKITVCLSCPFNKPFALNLETEEGQEYYRKASIATVGKYDKEPALGVCELYKHDNRILVWLIQKEQEKKKEAPDRCWIGQNSRK